MCEEIGVLSIGTYDGILYCYRIWNIPEGCTEIPEEIPEGHVGLYAKLLFNFKPHEGSVRSLASSKRYVASGGFDGSISIFDLKTMKNVGSLITHDDCVESLQFFQNSYLISGSADKTLCIWRTTDWSMMKQLKGHVGPVLTHAISNTGKFMLSGGKDGAIRMWDLMHAHNARTRKLNVIPVFIGFTDDSRQFFFGFDNNVVVVDGVSESTIYQFTHEKNVTCFSLNNNVLWIGTIEGHIYAWSMETGDSLGEYIISDDRIKMVKATRNLIVTLTSSGDCKIGIVDNEFNIDTVLSWSLDMRITCGSFSD
ncbi:p21-activated protein kinase-interacting protein 1-like [Histomonas meleagridis]|uniref:p21-activated protein kinase-interacting protein 1-like n=1 Tax=Histomonas meleagridis TaxID=135588 RepID=UPI00355A8CFB|nr:p21-activated protein kinase-interacting protein 1-like [Histomonas meleagridis]